ncbi:MAG: hypothetical protein L0Z50_05120 [Verrucomicrobiales bacterium]|nr:hypothetical protein [Verrucomicrobiales bacterium]
MHTHSQTAMSRLLPSRQPTHVDFGQELATGFAGRCIHRKRRQLIGKAGFKRSNQPDTEQEWSLALFQRLPRFDPTIAPRAAFVATVISRFAASVLAAWHTQTHVRGHVTASLHTHALGEDGRWTDLAQGVETRHVAAVTGRHSRNELDSAVSNNDLGTIIERLPTCLQQLCFWLQHGFVTVVARRANRSLTSLLRRIAQLRRVFALEGMKECLEIGRTLCC